MLRTLYFMLTMIPKLIRGNLIIIEDRGNDCRTYVGQGVSPSRLKKIFLSHVFTL